uniref:dCMP deaminase n=1 Tax=Amphimedon queenslandica TaxID=400682 RepID=A0A1X7T422_AMPQE
MIASWKLLDMAKVDNKCLNAGLQYYASPDVMLTLELNLVQLQNLHSADSVPITFLTVYLHIKVCHAELNAILNKNSADVKGCTIYVALFPCNECAKLIIQSGITEILNVSDKYHDTHHMIASRKLLDMAKVKYRLVSLIN